MSQVSAGALIVRQRLVISSVIFMVDRRHGGQLWNFDSAEFFGTNQRH